MHLEGGVPVPELAKIAQVHENTLYNWKKNYLEYGIEGLIDDSRAPDNHPNEYSGEIKQLVRGIRLTGLEKEKRYLGPKVIAQSQIDELLKDLRKLGIKISIIHGVDDKFFPMERVQQTATRDMVDGFYSVKGTHNEIYLRPDKHTKLIDQALDALEKKGEGSNT